MPKYYPFKVADHYLYFTAECIIEAMHVHARKEYPYFAGERKLDAKQSCRFHEGRPKPDLED